MYKTNLLTLSFLCLQVQYWLANETVKDGAYKETAYDVTQVEFTVPLEADYYVWVRAVNRGGEGIPSAAEPISTRPGNTQN